MDSGTPTVRRCRAAYVALQFAYWVNGSILIGFLLPYLHGLGFRDDTAGFLMAGVSLLGFLLPFLISSLSARLGLRLLPRRDSHGRLHPEKLSGARGSLPRMHEVREALPGTRHQGRRLHRREKMRLLPHH